MSSSLSAYRWDGSNQGTNAGDILSQYLLERLTYQATQRVPANYTKSYYMISGSVLSVANHNAQIRGTGIMNPSFGLQDINPQSVYAVRGPLTADYLSQHNITVSVFGDPGLLLPYVYQPNQQCLGNYKIGYIPHYTEYTYVKELHKDSQDSIVIDITSPLGHIINTISQCDTIVSSSLHGIIFAHAYHKPCVRTKWITELDTFKFLDYFSSIGINNPIQDTIIYPPLEKIALLQEGLIQSAPFLSPEQKEYRLQNLRLTNNITLSLQMIVKNESHNIDYILSKANLFADEIIIVDTGSQDTTIALAEHYTSQIYHFEWIDDFAAARNFAIRQSNGLWNMRLDVDDLLEEETIHNIITLKNLLPYTEQDIIMCNYNMYDKKNKVYKSNMRERFFRNTMPLHFHYPIHEHLDMTNYTSVFFPEISIGHKYKASTHRAKRNIRILEKAIETEQYSDSPIMWGYLAREKGFSGNICQGIALYKYILYFLGDKYPDVFYKALHTYELGLLYTQEKDYDNAKLIFKECAELFDQRREPFFELATIYSNQGNYQKAEIYYNKCLSIPRNNQIMIYNTAIYSDLTILGLLQELYRASNNIYAYNYIQEKIDNIER